VISIADFTAAIVALCPHDVSTRQIDRNTNANRTRIIVRCEACRVGWAGCVAHRTDPHWGEAWGPVGKLRWERFSPERAAADKIITTEIRAAMSKIQAVFTLAVVVILAACGGQVVPLDPACELETGDAVTCDAVDFYVFAPTANGATVGDQCRAVGCPRGERCAVVGELGTRYGICR